MCMRNNFNFSSWYNETMFTGIVEELGKIQKITSNQIIIECKTVLDDAKIGDSIAVNGVCLTVTELSSNSFSVNVSSETFKITTFGDLKTGDFVNLERAMSANGRFGGHIVSGHIDGVGKFLGSDSYNEFRFELPEDISKYVIKKGSVTINGISLTIATVDRNIITLAIIPHTLDNTNLKFLKSGAFVNIEVDMIAKYIEKFLSTSDNRSGVSIDLLQANGFI